MLGSLAFSYSYLNSFVYINYLMAFVEPCSIGSGIQ
uniref:Uncharacterized protein n=1 Tax=Arundo donax TaxID=35708 RepID=A0A0A9BA34_ARUDO